MKTTRIACLGGGNMGRALLAALLRTGTPAAALTVGEPHGPTRTALASDLGIAAHADNAPAIASADLILLAVKPQEAIATLHGLRSLLAANKPVLLSVAAGIRCAELIAASGTPRVVRAMPNRPALLGVGAAGLFAPPGVDQAARELAGAVLAAAGTIVWLPEEDQIDAVTAVSGSGPAYFFLMAEALAAAGVAQGLSTETARKLAIATLHGAGVMAIHGDGDLERLRAEVPSKGGTTAAALSVLDAHDGLRRLMADTVAAASLRSRQLGQAVGSSTNASLESRQKS